MSTQREEIELALKFAEIPSLDKLLITLNGIKTVSDELSAKALIPTVEASVVEALKKIAEQQKAIVDNAGKLASIDTVGKMNADAKALLETEAKLIKATNDFVQALSDEDKELSNIQGQTAKLKATKADLEKQIKQSIQSGNTETDSFKQQNQALVGVNKVIADLSEKKKKLTAITTAQIKEDKAADGSVEKLRLTLARLTKQYDSLSQAEEKSGKGQGLRKQISELNTQVSTLEQGTGRFQRNVGNYKDAFEGFLDKIPGGDKVKQFTKTFSDISSGIASVGVEAEGAAVGSTALSGSLSALAAGGIVVGGAIALMASSFFRTTEGAEDLNIATGALSGAFSGLLSAFNPFSDNYGHFITQLIKGAEAGINLAKIENEQINRINELTKQYGKYNDALALSNELQADTGLGLLQRSNELEKSVSSRIALNLVEQAQLQSQLEIKKGQLNQEQQTEGDRRAASLEVAKAQAALNSKVTEGIIIQREGIKQISELKKQAALIDNDIDDARLTASANLAAFEASNTSKTFEQRRKALFESAADRALVIQHDIEDQQALIDIDKKRREATEQKTGAKSSLSAEEIANTKQLITLQGQLDLLKQQTDEQSIDLAIQQFKLESGFVRAQFDAKKSLLEEDLKNDKISFDSKRESVNKLKVLNEDFINKSQGKAVTAFGQIKGFDTSKLDLNKLSQSENLEKDIQLITSNKKAQGELKAIILDINATKQRIAKSDKEINDAQIADLKKFTDLLEKSKADNITANPVDIAKIVQLEKDQSAAIEAIRHSAALQAIEDERVRQGSIKQVDDAILEEKIKNANELRKIDIEFIKKTANEGQGNINLERDTQVRIASETIKNKEDLSDKIKEIDAISLQNKISLEIQEIADLKAKNANTLDLEDQLQKDLTKLAIDASEERKAKINKFIEESLSDVNSVLGGVEEGFKRNAERIGNELSKQTENIQHQTELAAAGLNNTLSFEENKKVELERQQEDARRKAEKAAKLQAFFNLLAEYAKENPNTAAAKALVQVAIGDAIVEGKFEQGSEGTIGDSLARKGRGGGVKRNGMIYGRRHSGGGVVIEAEANEAILNRKAVSDLGTDFIKDANKGVFKDDFFRKHNDSLQTVIVASKSENGKGYLELLEEVKGLTRAINEKPVASFNIDNMGRFIETEIAKGIKRVTTYQKPKFGGK